MPWYHRTSPRRAKAILESGFRDDQVKGKLPGIWISKICDPDSNDNCLADGAVASMVIIAVEIPDAVVASETLRSDEEDRGAFLPAALLNRYPRRLETHAYAEDPRQDMKKFACGLKQDGKAELEVHVNELIELLDTFGWPWPNDPDASSVAANP
jgi:hypothetical protein